MWPAGSRRGGRDRGFSLLDTLISTALFSVVIAGVYLLYTTMQGTMSRGEMKADLQQNARVGLDRPVQDLRMAGYDPSGALPQVALPPKDALRAAGPACLSFVTSTGSQSTQVTYDLDGTTLRRRVDSWNGDPLVLAFQGGSAQPDAESIHLLSFAYFDRYNQPVAPVAAATTQRCPPQSGASASTQTLLTLAQLRQVKRIIITLRTRDWRPRRTSDVTPPAGASVEYYTLTSDVRLRNR